MENKDYNFVAGTNGDMFTIDSGDPDGINLHDGILLNNGFAADEITKPSIGVDANDKAIIDELTITGQATIPGENSENLSIDYLNREFFSNRVTLYTKIINTDSTVHLEREGAYIIFETNQSEDIIPGEKISGKIVDYTENHTAGIDVKIKDNQYLLAGDGSKAQEFRDFVKNKDKIEVKFDIFVDEVKNNNFTNIITSYNWLVKDGTALTEQDMLDLGYGAGLVSTKNARTAIGITANNEVIMMTIDKQTPSSSYSKGVTLPAMAEVMKEEGVVSAIGLDGGGSTQMNVKPEGMFNLEVQNELGDGSERKITNGIFINYDAESSDEIGKIIISPDDLVIYKESEYPFEIKATDINGGPIEVEDFEQNWTSKEGTINNDGLYTAPKFATKDLLEVTLGGVSKSVEVNVVDKIDALTLTDEIKAINSGDSMELSAKAWLDNKEIIIDSKTLNWELSRPSLGDIKENILTLNENIPFNTETELNVSIGDVKASMKLYINKQDQIIYDFENYKVGQKPFPGNKVYVSTYDFEISDINEKPSEELQTKLLPKRLGMWVHSDNQEVPWIRAIVVDGNGNRQTLNMTAGDETWDGWRFITAKISDHIPVPLNLYQVYLAEINYDYREDASVGGQVFFDDIQWVYEDVDKEDGDIDTEAAEKVSNLLATLPTKGNVTLEDKDAIEAGRRAYDELTDVEKYLVVGYAKDRLTNAEAELKESNNQVKKVKSSIYNLPKASELTLADKDKIKEVRDMYDNLSDDDKEFVTSISQLEAREDKLKELEK